MKNLLDDWIVSIEENDFFEQLKHKLEIVMKKIIISLVALSTLSGAAFATSVTNSN